MQGLADSPGIIPRSVTTLFQKIGSQPNAKEYTISVSFLELYQENLYDLLNPENRPKIREENKTPFVENLQELPITCRKHFDELYYLACKNLKTSATKLNSNSSRSHAIIMFQIFCKGQLNAKVNFIDLAGCEDNRKTENTGKLLSESSTINLSLMALRSVVDALVKEVKSVIVRKILTDKYIYRKELTTETVS
jgi:kinesin family protein 22